MTDKVSKGNDRGVYRMQIQTGDMSQSIKSGIKPAAIGQIHAVSIKERISATEALVSMGGKDMRMTFENGIPSDNRIQIEITGVQTDLIKAKQVPRSAEPLPTREAAELDALMKSAGVDASSMKELAQMLSRNGYSITNELLKGLQDFLKTEAGTNEQKLVTIESAARRGLEMSISHLKAIHASLHGESISRVVGDLASELPRVSNVLSNNRSEMTAIVRLMAAIESSENMADIRKHVMEFLKEAQPSLFDKRAILKALSEGKEAILQTLRLAGQKGSGQEVLTEEGKWFKDLLKMIQKQPSIEQVLMQAKQFGTMSGMQGLQGSSDFMATVAKAEQLTAKGRELLARKELTDAVKRLEESNPQIKQPPSGLVLSAVEANDIEQAVQSLKLDSKSILVTQISERLAQLAIDFKQAKRDIVRNLDQSLQLLSIRQPQARQVLEATIKQLDTAILKGEYMLYADMATEKKLLLASGRLQEARALLAGGNLAGASDIVREMKALTEGIMFKPSEVRLKHFTAGMDDAQTPLYKPEQSGRQLFELIRKLGMMNEADTARTLMDGKQQGPQANLKSSLLQALNEGTLSPKLAHQAEQIVQTITGQQLLAKPDSSGMQQLAFQLPLILQKQVENVKVFVNGQGGKESIDWENCRLYFVMETKRLGEIGISLTAHNRNLLITFNSDKKDLPHRLEPLTESVFGRLEEIGYVVGSLQVKPFKRETEETEAGKEVSQQLINPFAGKGYDRTI